MNEFTYMEKGNRNFEKGRKYIGASDMPTLSGINQYKTPYEFWAEWTGRKEAFRGNKRTNAGHMMEPVILGQYVSDQAIKLGEYGKGAMNNFISSRMFGELQHEQYYSWTECRPPENPRFVAHADLLDLSGDIPVLVQAKNSGMMAANTRKRNPFKGYAKEDLSQNGVPLGVYIQEQWEMYCYGIPESYVAVMIDGWDYRLYGPIKYRKKDVEKMVLLADRMLWHIDKDKPPTPETWPDVLAQFPDFEKATKSTVSGDEELDCKNHIAQFHKCSEKIRVLTDRKLDIQMGLALHACEPDLGIMRNYLTDSAGNTLASFYEKQGQMRINYKKVSESPELLAQCEAIGAVSQDDPSRSMSISGAVAGSIDLFTLITYPDGKDGKPNKRGKKFTKAEKKDIDSVMKKAGTEYEWERYST